MFIMKLKERKNKGPEENLKAPSFVEDIVIRASDEEESTWAVCRLYNIRDALFYSVDTQSNTLISVFIWKVE